MKRWLKIAAGTTALGLTACVTVPSGPTNTALPGSRKSFEEFQADDARCRQYAMTQSGASAAENANNSAVASAIVGTLIGAAAGAAIGGNGAGAGVGAGVGLLAGSAAGADAAQTSYHVTQQRYDGAYTQCMYAAGNKVAMTGHFAQAYRRPQRSAPAYPPPGSPPPYGAPNNTTAGPPANLPPGSIPPPDAPPPR